jgi:hypothetical protein
MAGDERDLTTMLTQITSERRVAMMTTMKGSKVRSR